MHSYIPGYIRARQTGRLKQAVQQGLDMLSACTLCPRRCRMDRTGDNTGYCGAGRQAKVASFSPHFGEEPPLVGDHGSGTIFFSHCSLQCVFCQNHEISVQGEGHTVFPNQLAAMMIRLQEQGCHNINFHPCGAADPRGPGPGCGHGAAHSTGLQLRRIRIP